MQWRTVVSHAFCGILGGMVASTFSVMAISAGYSVGPIKATSIQLVTPTGAVRGDWSLDKDGMPTFSQIFGTDESNTKILNMNSARLMFTSPTGIVYVGNDKDGANVSAVFKGGSAVLRAGESLGAKVYCESGKNSSTLKATDKDSLIASVANDVYSALLATTSKGSRFMIGSDVCNTLIVGEDGKAGMQSKNASGKAMFLCNGESVTISGQGPKTSMGILDAKGNPIWAAY